MMKRSEIIGCGSYLPERVVTNAELSAKLDTTDEWITTRTGIRQRHLAADGELTSDLALKAAERALENANIPASEVDMVVLATTTPDNTFPATATKVQDKLGMVNGAAFDIQAVCSGFIYGMAIADNFIKTSQCKAVVLIGAETFSRILDWEDRSTCVLFGDGAGAVILEASEETGILSTHLHADGRYEELLHVPCGVANDFDAVKAGKAFVEMKGNEVFKVAVNTLGRIVDETLEANQMEKSDIDWLVPHQANLRIISATARKLGMSMDQVVVTVNRHGNTSAASVPLALDEAVRDSRIQRGQVVLLEAFGGGFTWGSALLKY